MTNDEVLAKLEIDFMLRNLSPRTQEVYLEIIEYFRLFAGKELYSDLNQDDLRSYQIHLHSSGLEKTTINQYSSACRFLLRNCLSQNIDYSQVPNAKIDKPDVRPFLVSQLLLFFSLIQDISQFAFFLVLYGTGARGCEIRRLRIEDIVSSGKDGVYYLRIEKTKGHKSRTVQVPEACVKALRLYWKVKKPGRGYLFPASNNDGFVSDGYFRHRFERILAKDSRLAGLTQHGLRHSYATHYLQHDRNGILDLKYQLGHSSLRSTEIYVETAAIYHADNDMSPEEICNMLYERFCLKHGIRLS